QVEVALLGRAGRADRPGPVPEVALDLAVDRAAGERRERDAPLGVVALDRFQRAEQGDLDEIVEFDPPAAVVVGDRRRQAPVGLDEAVAEGPVAGGDIGPEQLLVIAAVGHAPARVRLTRRNLRPSLSTVKVCSSTITRSSSSARSSTVAPSSGRPDAARWPSTTTSPGDAR